MTFDITRASASEVMAEAARRAGRRAAGLPIEDTPEERDQRLQEEDDRLEKEIQASVRDLYIAHGCVVYWLSQARKTKQTAGLGDLYVFHPPTDRAKVRLAWWHETKTPTGEQSPDQVQFEEFCILTTVPYVCGGVAAAEEFLRRIGAWNE